jgi:hypothetical protein
MELNWIIIIGDGGGGGDDGIFHQTKQMSVLVMQ